MAYRKVARSGTDTAVPRRSTRIRDQAVVTNTTNTSSSAEQDKNRVTKSTPKRTLKPGRKECTTCFRTLAAVSFPRVTKNCKHEFTTCKACLKTWIESQLTNVTYDNISCPECSETIDNAGIKKNGSARAHARFDEFERRCTAEKIPGWRWCLDPKCKGGAVHLPSHNSATNPDTTAHEDVKLENEAKDQQEEDMCECQECGAKACVRCNKPYHDGKSCDTAKFEEEEEATSKTIQEVSKPCPNCKKNIQRAGGCDHMVCSQCRTQFCYLCLTDYATINKSGHGEGCIYSKPGRIDPHANGFHIGGHPIAHGAGLFAMGLHALGHHGGR